MFDFIDRYRAHCPPAARALGYLGEAVGIEGRFRRVGDAWREHIDNCHRTIRTAVEGCPQKRTVAVAGGGLLHDVPLAELAAEFQRVLLVDICHTPASRRHFTHLPNVEEVVADVTETVHLLHTLPNHEQPFHCPIPSLLRDRADLDLTVSLNLFSQLPCMPKKFLEKWGYGPRWIEDYSHKVMKRHLDWLRALPGRKVLITDIERQMLDVEGRIREAIDLTYKVPLPIADAEWIWRLAPIPEISREYHYYRRVVGYADFR